MFCYFRVCETVESIQIREILFETRFGQLAYTEMLFLLITTDFIGMIP